MDMPMRDVPSSPLVLTSHDGRWWITELDRVGAIRGSFATREAAAAAGRALAVEADAPVVEDANAVAPTVRPARRRSPSAAARRSAGRRRSRFGRARAR